MFLHICVFNSRIYLHRMQWQIFVGMGEGLMTKIEQSHQTFGIWEEDLDR